MSETESDQPVAEEELVSTEDAGVADEAHAQGDDQTDETDEEALEGQSEDEETEEIERAGKRYRIPKALSGELLMQADYTRKTQELAESRKAFEAAQAEREANLTELRADIGRVTLLETHLKSYENVDWTALRHQDPDSYRLHYDQFRELKDQLKDAKESLSAKEQARLREQQGKMSQAAQEAREVLQRDIPGFNQEVAQQILEYGEKRFGLTKQEAAQLIDPRVLKLLHHAKALEQKVATYEKKQTVQKRVEAVQQVKPAVSVKGSAPAAGLSDNLSTSEWQRRFLAQRAKRA